MALQNLLGELALDASVQDVVEELQKTSRISLDYGARTDSQPVYLGSAPPATLPATVLWTVYRFTYESAADDARMTSFDIRSPIAWDNRADPTQDGQPAWT